MRPALAIALATGGAAAAIWAGTSALADMQARSLHYLCDRGVMIPVVYVTDTAARADGLAGVAVLQVEGRQILLHLEPAGSGARYGWPGGGGAYVWHSQGDAALLLWRDANGAQTPVVSDCRAQD